MAVTVSTQPIKLYITDPKTNTAHPVGGVLTEEQQNTINSASSQAQDALLKTSSEKQVVTSSVEFNNPVLGVNSSGGEDGTPTSDAELTTWGQIKTQLTPITTQLESLSDLPSSEMIATVNGVNSFTAKQDFQAGLTTASYEDVNTASDATVLNKADTVKLISHMQEGIDVATNVHVVATLPAEGEMLNGHVYVELG